MPQVAAALLLVAALGHSLYFFPTLVLPLLVVLLVRARHSMGRALLLVSGIWAVAQSVLLVPLVAPTWTYRLDLRILHAEAARFQDEWSPWGRVVSIVVLLAAVPAVGRLSLAARQVSFLALLGVATVASLWSFEPDLLTEFSQVRPSGYGHDHFLYQENWRQMKLGLGYYAAAAQAFRADLRGQGATVRPPLLFYLWKLLPMPPLTLFGAFTLMTLMAVAGAYALARELGAGELSVLAPGLLVPQYFYAAYSAVYLFMEYWVIPLAFLSALSLLRGRPRTALALALVSALMREFMAVYLFGLSLVMVARWGRAQFGPLVVAWLSWAVCYSLHVSASQWVMAQNGAQMSNLLETFGHGGWDNLKACFGLGSLLLPVRPWAVACFALSGFLGLTRLRGPSRLLFVFGVLPYLVVFTFLGHEPVLIEGRPFYATEIWGAYFMLWWPVLVALALSPQVRAGTPGGEGRTRAQ